MTPHYTHLCMNCGPVGSLGQVTVLNAHGHCERCDSEAITPIDRASTSALTDDAIRLAALEVFHEEIVREKNHLIVILRLREKDFAEALSAYRTNHPKCAVSYPPAGDRVESRRRSRQDRRCRRCKRADWLLGTVVAVDDAGDAGGERR